MDGLVRDLEAVQTAKQQQADKASAKVEAMQGKLDAAKGKPFYDNLVFHRVEPGFVVQGGDPAGNGSGGPGYEFPNEIHPDLVYDTAGVVGMANAGPDTNGSQFFICIDDCRRALTPSYNLFGYVTEGMDVALATEVGDVMETVAIEELAGE